ncbi:MAG: hypothetical protein KZQ97_13890 [Candidatus Thiodiazotropha sp. (ex Dulcina madagascariensis)]|nr:hypothetical protein [Candidatus Thiodiazotropha sp. (ex Dulcina madagascariensis)]
MEEKAIYMADCLASSHQRFYAMLDRCPRISHLWDRERAEIKIDLFESELGVMSPGEVHLAKFMASVWFGDNHRYGFDLADAVACMDSRERQIILEWVADPFWP